ncbi:MAG: hypothetical protein IPL40_16200 [Proteobacteria bacterium]|nr:hypothetical protein [Pseudomonadota bacterium]
MEMAVAQREPGDRSLRWLLATIGLLSILLGGFSYWRYRQAEVELRAALVTLGQRGTQVSAEGCIDAALQWTQHCSALLDLCDASVSRVVNACLRATDRSADCRALGQTIEDPRVVFRRCAKHGAHGRRGNKNCVEAYRMLAASCRSGAGTP